MSRRPRAEAPSFPLRVRLSPDERQLATKAALVNRQNLSQFVRDAIVTASADCLESVTIPTRRQP